MGRLRRREMGGTVGFGGLVGTKGVNGNVEADSKDGREDV